MNDIEKQTVDDLHSIIQEKQTASVLWIVPQIMMPSISSMVGIACSADNILHQAQTRYDIGIAFHVDTQLPPEQTDHLYARLRDQWCKITYLLEKHSRRQHLSALGFRLLKRYQDNTLFYFDIYDYKKVPDWLNSRFWAHPEMWGKR